MPIQGRHPGQIFVKCQGSKVHVGIVISGNQSLYVQRESTWRIINEATLDGSDARSLAKDFFYLSHLVLG